MPVTPTCGSQVADGYKRAGAEGSQGELGLHGAERWQGTPDVPGRHLSRALGPYQTSPACCIGYSGILTHTLLVLL